MPKLTPSEFAALQTQAKKDVENPDPLVAALYAAIKANDDMALNSYLVARVSPNRLVRGAPLLALACAFPSPKSKIVRLLLSHPKCEVDATDMYGSTATHQAIGYGHVDLLVDLLKKKADPNFKDSRGRTPLCYACERKGSEVAIRTLLARPNINVHPDPVWDPMVTAIASGHLDYVALLAAHEKIKLNRRFSVRILLPTEKNNVPLLVGLDETLPYPHEHWMTFKDVSYRELAESLGYSNIASYLLEREKPQVKAPTSLPVTSTGLSILSLLSFLKAPKPSLSSYGAKVDPSLREPLLTPGLVSQ